MHWMVKPEPYHVRPRGGESTSFACCEPGIYWGRDGWHGPVAQAGFLRDQPVVAGSKGI